MAQSPNASTNFLSPEDYAQMLRQAEMENRAGLLMNQAPRHWTQALAGALNQGLSGYRAGQAQERNQATQADANAQLAQLLQGGGNIEAAMANPRSAQQAFQYQAQAPQREFQQFKMNQAREMAPLNMELKRAQIAQAQRRASEEANARFGKTGAIFQDPNSKQYYTVQFADDGTRKITPLKGDLTPANLSPTAAADKTTAVKEAEANVKGRQGLAKSGRSMASAEISDSNLFRSLDNAKRLSSPWTTGFVGSISKYVAGSPSSDLAIELQQVKANMGFGALQQMRDNSPTGGALGQVTERELALLQNAEVALDQAQSLPAFRAALGRIRKIKTQYAKMRRKAWEQDIKRFGAENVPSPFIDQQPAQEAPASPASGGRMDFGQGGMAAPSGFSIRKLD